MNQFSNNTPFNVFGCSGGSNQNFLHANDNTGLQWGPGQGPQAVQTRTIQSTQTEAWLVARSVAPNFGFTNVGHAFVATVIANTEIQQRLDGMIWVNVSTRITSFGDYHTFTRWPSFNPLQWIGRNYDNKFDLDVMHELVYNGRLSDGSSFAIRKALISPDLAQRISNSIIYQTGCVETYTAICPCTNYSSRLWNSITGEAIGLPEIPNLAVDRINSWNNAFGQYAGNGKLFN